jgi:ankyrin repeat protein
MATLPSFDSEAGMRALDAKCENRNAPDSTRTVVQLSKLPLATQKSYMNNSAVWDLPHLIRCLLEAGLSADVRCASGNATALQVAAGWGRARALRALLTGGANHALVDDQSITVVPLFDASQSGRSDCVQLLLDAGADANAVSVLGNTPLIIAVAKNHAECVRLLLRRSDLGITNYMGRTVLHVCVTTASEECFALLLPHYADVDVRTVQGVDEKGAPLEEAFDVTPLHLACDFGQHEMAKALLRRGASRLARDSDGRTPLHDAAFSGNLRCVILLLGRADNFKMTPAEVNTACEIGATALYLGAEKGNEKICGLLIEAGARLDVRTASGHIPLMIAQHNHPANAALHALLSGQGPSHVPGTVCDRCGKSPAQASVQYLKTCSACQSVRYCGAACSVAAWQGHKAACKARVAEVAARAKGRVIELPSPGQ